MKIKADDELKYKIGYFSAEEIISENHQVNILNYIGNRINNSSDILSADLIGQ